MEREVRIFQPTKTAMQSGHAKTRCWNLTFKPHQQKIEPLMGWPASGDMNRELHLTFSTLDEAIHHAKKHQYTYTVEKQKVPLIHSKSYGDNFKGRIR